MKRRIVNYTWVASTGAITFTDFTAIALDAVLVITNVTDQVGIYNFADPALGGTVATNVLTVEFDTSGMDNADKLQIWYDDGNAAHDEVDVGAPTNVGVQAIAHGSNPTAVAAGDRTRCYGNRHGIPFVLGGHPNIDTSEYNTTGAQTNDNILNPIGTGFKYVITQIDATCDNANTNDTGVRIGFGSTTVPAKGASGAVAVDGILLSHPGIATGSGIVKGNGSGIVGIGGAGEELRITCEDPGGELRVVVSHFVIES